MQIMEFCLKWVHMGRYELILRLDGALWLLIISGPLLTQKVGHKNPKNIKKSKIPKICIFLALAAIHPGWGNRYLTR